MVERAIHESVFMNTYLHTNIYQNIPIQTEYASMRTNIYHIHTNMCQNMPIRANEPCICALGWQIGCSAPQMHDQMLQILLQMIKSVRRRPAWRADFIHELLDVGQYFNSLLLYSSHRRLDGMDPIYPVRPRARKSNKYLPSSENENE